MSTAGLDRRLRKVEERVDPSALHIVTSPYGDDPTKAIQAYSHSSDITVKDTDLCVVLIRFGDMSRVQK
jgi:hypothetical protein